MVGTTLSAKYQGSYPWRAASSNCYCLHLHFVCVFVLLQPPIIICVSDDSDNGNDKDKDKVINSPPVWKFVCVREVENAKRERIEKMGIIPAFDADMAALASRYGQMAAEGKAFLATLSDDSDDETLREINARRAKLGRSNMLG